MNDQEIIAKALCGINNKLLAIFTLESIKLSKGASEKQHLELIESAAEGALSYDELKGSK